MTWNKNLNSVYNKSGQYLFKNLKAMEKTLKKGVTLHKYPLKYLKAQINLLSSIPKTNLDYSFLLKKDFSHLVNFETYPNHFFYYLIIIISNSTYIVYISFKFKILFIKFINSLKSLYLNLILTVFTNYSSHWDWRTSNKDRKNCTKKSLPHQL